MELEKLRYPIGKFELPILIIPGLLNSWIEDIKLFPIVPSLQIIERIHQRWVVLLSGITSSDLKKTFIHPEHNKEFSVDEIIGTYAWYGNHHLAHITELKKIKNW